MNDFRDLKAIAEVCQQYQPLRFMRSHGALYIRNDNGIVFDVHQNRSFPEFVAQNKDYADLVLAAKPAAVLELIAEIDRRGERNVYWIDQANSIARDRNSIRSERDQLKAENARSTEREIHQLAEIEALRKALCAVMNEVDGNIRETVRDCVNGHNDVQDIYGYCDSIEAIVDAALTQEPKP